ncbi:hypothetical protein MJI37_33840, partial [Salmonella enterica subsp. enterica serovar Cerro]|nr:hypothetical protein [Salmonella enterica subsp. enterica serovar Cerro]
MELKLLFFAAVIFGALGACGQEAQARGVSHLFVMVDSFLHQAGMTAPLARSLAM